MLLLAIGYIVFACQHPELSLPFSAGVIRLLYGLYAAVMLLLFLLALPRKGSSRLYPCLMLLETASVFCLIEAILTTGNNWFLPAALLLNAVSMGLLQYTRRKEKHTYENKEE